MTLNAFATDDTKLKITDNMNINGNISIFQGATFKDGKFQFPVIPYINLPIGAFFGSVKRGEYDSEVHKLRNSQDPELKKIYKLQLPSVTLSGSFMQRKADRLIKHSGFICLDFDGKENPQVSSWPETRNNIGQIAEVAFCALSASGNGCFAVIPIGYPEHHDRQFAALVRDFKTLGFNVDKSGSDVSRLRFMSSDPDAILNLSAETYRRIYTPHNIGASKYNRTYQTECYEKIYEDARHWLDKRESFVNGNRNHYITELTGYLHRFGVPINFTMSKCLEFTREDFTVKEIESITRSIYKNQSWTGKAIQQ